MSRSAPTRAALLVALVVVGIVLLFPGRDAAIEASAPAAPTPAHEEAARPTRPDGAPVAGRDAPVRPVLPRGRLRVTVRDDLGRPDPAAWAEPLDCPGLRLAPGELEPDVLSYTAFSGRCALRAVRHDGLLRTEGAAVVAEIPEDGVAEIVLPIPSARTGGVQLAFQPASSGVRILWVPPHLEDEGIARGDILVAVAGTPVADLHPEEVVALLTGPEGTAREIELLPGGDTGLDPIRLDLELQAVEPP